MSVNKVNSDGSLTRVAGIMPVDQTYNPLSERPQSGIAVAAAVAGGGGGGLLPHLIIISEDSESEVKAVKGSTEIIATRTSAGHYECDVPEFGTWTIHAILNGDDAQVNLVVDTVKIYTVDDSHFHADITVTYPSGGTCSCSKEGETTLYATGSPYTFTVHSAGAWTITATAYEKTFTQTVNVSATGQTVYISVPDGATVTPTDDVQTLLACAGIGDSQITTLAELFADTTTLSAVISSANAIDYMVRSTTWAATISVPTMTSATTPSGEVTASSIYDSNYSPYKAFDKNTSTYWASQRPISSDGEYLEYEFDSACTITKARIYNNTGYPTVGNYRIQNYVDGEWKTLYSGSNSVNNIDEVVTFVNTAKAIKYRLQVDSVTEVGAAINIVELDFISEGVADNATAMTYIGLNNYAANTLLADATWCNAICNSTYIESVLNVKSPDMTGDTTPSGEVTASSYIGSYYPWRTFDGQINTAWATGYGGGYSTGSWIKYKFPEEVTIYALKYYHRNSDGTIAYPVRIEGSSDDSNFDLVKTFTENIDNAYHTVVFDTPSSYEWYRWYNTGETVSNLDEVKYYGRKDV